MNVIESNAPAGKRFLNNLLDIAGFYLGSLMLGLVLGVLQAITGIPFIDILEQNNQHVVGIVIIIVYFILFESIFGRTPAKFITKTRVLDENGDRPSLDKIIVRSLIRLIPFEGLAIFGEGGRTLHDKWSGTYVIDEKLRASLQAIDE